MVNAKLQGAVRCLAERKGLPPQLAEGFSLKSARKAVASHLSASGCSPQVVAQRLGHGSLQSQMHYICKFFGMRPNLLSVIYQGLWSWKADSRRFLVLLFFLRIVVVFDSVSFWRIFLVGAPFSKFTMWEHTYWALFEASHRFFSNSAVVPDLALCMYTLNKHRQKCNLLFNFYLTQRREEMRCL